MRYLVVLYIPMLKTSLFELPRAKMYRNWTGLPFFLIGKDSPRKSYIDEFIENYGKENIAGHSVILPANIRRSKYGVIRLYKS